MAQIALSPELSAVPPTAFEALYSPVRLDFETETDPSIDPTAYEHYLKIHKVLVGVSGAAELLGIYEQLNGEDQPKILSAAGWAAAEVALVRSDLPLGERQELLDAGQDCWLRALERQKFLNGREAEQAEYAYPHRIALDIAIMPLLRGVVSGKVDKSLRQRVFGDCLNVAQSNAVNINIAAKESNVEALAAHSGFGYECNALLGFNLKFAKGWFVMPSMARSDNGLYHPQQTHDLLVVHHRKGEVINMTPVEIKAAASNRDRMRYKALLVRGKMHLSVQGKYTPEETLKAIAAVYEGRANREELTAVDCITNRFVEMVRDYYAGEHLGYLATARSVTRFRDSSLVVAKHPGLAVATAV